MGFNYDLVRNACIDRFFHSLIQMEIDKDAWIRYVLLLLHLFAAGNPSRIFVGDRMRAVC